MPWTRTTTFSNSTKRSTLTPGLGSRSLPAKLTGSHSLTPIGLWTKFTEAPSVCPRPSWPTPRCTGRKTLKNRPRRLSISEKVPFIPTALVIRIIIPILTSPRKIMSMVIPMVMDLISNIRAAVVMVVVAEVMEGDNTPTVIEEDNMVANKEGGDSLGKVVGKSKASGAMGDEVNTVAGHVSSVNGPITRRMDGRMIGKSLKSIVGGSLRSRDGRGMMNKIGNSQGNSGHNEDGSSSKKLGHNGHRLSQEGGQINSKGISQEGGQINSKDLGHRLDGHNRMHRDQICLRRDGFLALGLGMVNNNPSINSSSTHHNNNNNNNNSSIRGCRDG